MPGVEVRLVDDRGRPVEPGGPGEIEVRGPTVFRRYWRRPESTSEAFRDGWFRTGDMAVWEGGTYRIRVVAYSPPGRGNDRVVHAVLLKRSR